MKKFSIGGIYTNYAILNVFLKLVEKYNSDYNTSVVRNETSFDSVFGSFPNILWNGGRNLSGMPTLSLKNVKNFIDFYHQNNISVRLTLSNKLIEKKHLTDFYCNEILELLDPNIDGVILASDILKDYIKGKLPAIQTICSVTCVPPDLKSFASKIDHYDLVVLPSELNKDLSQLTDIDPSKIEILVNERCIPFCAHKEEHQTLISLGNLGFDPSLDENFCTLRNGKITGGLELTTAEVDDIYNNHHITHFKISSRLIDDPEFQICKFMIRDEYQFEFFANLVSNKSKQL